MTPSSPVLERLLRTKIVAVVRSSSGENLVEVAKALLEGGVEGIEITFTVPNAPDVIRRVRSELGDAIALGAGTVLDAESARIALLAGASYVVAPTLDLATIALCRRHGAPVMPGAFTPTEVLKAWEAGASVVKLFPADVGGPAYLKAIKAPLPHVLIMPTGGVDLGTARAFLDAGACCLGVGSALVDPKLVAKGDYSAIRERARAFAALVKD